MTSLHIRILSMGLLGTILAWVACPLNAFGKVPYSEYSEAKKKAYHHLIGISTADMTFTPPPAVPSDLPAAGRNSKTTGLMNQTIKEGLYEILGDDGLREELWDGCFYELGVWATVSPDKGDFERLRPFVEKIETSSMEGSEKMTYLRQAYRSVGRIGTPEAKAFLRERMTRDFWGDTMPKANITVGSQTIVQTAQSEATAAYGVRGDDDSISYLKSLAQTPEIQKSPELHKVIQYHIETAPDKRRVIEQDQAFHRHVKGEVEPSSSRPGAVESGFNHRLRSILLVGIPASIVVLLLVRAYRGRMPSQDKN